MGLVILLVIVTAGILLCGFEYAYGASLNKRDWTIKLLKEQIKLA